MKAFELDGAHAVAELDDEERTVIARMVADVALVLGSESFGNDDAPELSDKADELVRYLSRLADSATEPTDPAVLRVLPNAAPTDREVTDEFRRLTEPGLRDTKIARLRAIWDQLSDPTATAWTVALEDCLSTASALTDVRLVIATRLGIDSDHDAERLHHELVLAEHAMTTGAGDQLLVEPERVWLGMLYEALTWLQESLMTCLMADGKGGEQS